MPQWHLSGAAGQPRPWFGPGPVQRGRSTRQRLPGVNAPGPLAVTGLDSERSRLAASDPAAAAGPFTGQLWFGGETIAVRVAFHGSLSSSPVPRCTGDSERPARFPGSHRWDEEILLIACDYSIRCV